MIASVHRSQALLDEEARKRLQHPVVLSTSRQAWRAGRPRASRPPQGKPGEPAALGRAGRLKSKPGEPAASRQAWRAGRAGRLKASPASRPPSGEPAALCGLKTVLNFGFGLRPWGSPPAVALANFLLNWLRARVSNQLSRSLPQAFVCRRARHLSPAAFRYSFL